MNPSHHAAPHPVPRPTPQSAAAGMATEEWPPPQSVIKAAVSSFLEAAASERAAPEQAAAELLEFREAVCQRFKQAEASRSFVAEQDAVASRIGAVFEHLSLADDGDDAAWLDAVWQRFADSLDSPPHPARSRPNRPR